MGYLSNKKHQTFIKTNLNIFLFFSLIITFISFFQNDLCSLLAEYRALLYILLTMAFFYTIFKKMYLFAFLFFILGTINFFAISSTNNFFSPKHNANLNSILFGSHQTNISPLLKQISNNTPDIVAITNSNLHNFEIQDIIPQNYTVAAKDDKFQNFIITNLPIKQSGHINLGFDCQAPFVKVEKNGLPITYIAVDFSAYSLAKTNIMLKKISSFITKQDNPVVIFGNFNTVSWSYSLSAFIDENNLSVKNAFFDNIRNLIFPPHYYILGYNEGNFVGNIIFPHLNSFAKFTRF